ncbi:MAG: hypothetical protein A2428_11295 [Bdellovibrionales bacterium RIFOXYC1_FULL_54_43]|nr:MAG: hypothetical protein A2428_11295 [Bdellovibrionales bacterium RIFOXYC1_FULL_54_43]OFZ81028.1 MAG: hypothetical protein A2603_04605 [Bdellovibrionales bacterium RIFOXYD1_FULL_55_31]
MRSLIAMGLLIGLSASLAFGADPSPLQIVQKADLARGPGGAYSVIAKVLDYSKGKLRTETAYRVYVKGNELCLVETIEPVRLRGRKLLMNGNDLWFFLPTIKRPTRVSLQQRLTGEVSNGDIARTNFAADYNVRILGTEKIQGTDSYRLELKAKSKNVTYDRLEYWVSKTDLKPLRATFFALSGKPLKNATYSDFKPSLGRPVMTRTVITDYTQPLKRSELVYGQFRREKLDDSFFNKDSITE